MTNYCRHCKEKLIHQVIDLGHQPPSNAYKNKVDLDKKESTYPLRLYVCHSCWLVQIPEYASACDLFTDDYAYFSSTSTSWSLHAKKFVEEVISNLGLDKNSNVLEIASNDGYLLKNFVDKEIPCVGIEPTKACANASRLKGIRTIEEFFSTSFAEKLSQINKFDLIIANNVLAHVPDINDFVRGIATTLKRDGFVSIEFPHLLSLIKFNQFDTIYHEHYSYFSLSVVQKIVNKFGLDVVDVEELITHGGSLRVWLRHSYNYPKSKNVERILGKEKLFGLENLKIYDDFQEKSLKIKSDFIRYVLTLRDSNLPVIAYGAAAKGNTLINYAGIKNDLIDFIVDKAISKQGKYMPGSNIPIFSDKYLENFETKELIVFPWNLIEELKIQLKKYTLVTFIPRLSKW